MGLRLFKICQSKNFNQILHLQTFLKMDYRMTLTEFLNPNYCNKEASKKKMAGTRSISLA
jgi:hypothetical protein